MMELSKGGISNTPPTTRFNNICVDYIKITWTYKTVEENNKYKNLKDDLAKVLNVKPNEIQYDPNGRGPGYPNKYNLGTDLFYFDGLMGTKDNMYWSKMFEAKGQGCRDLEKRNVDLIKLFDFMNKTGGRITRFDLAYDDFICEYCDIFKIFEYVNGDYYTSCIQDVSIRFDKKKKMYKGLSITFGKTGGKKQLQIYDKLLERKVNYEVDSDFIDKWIRYEMRFGHEMGQSVFRKYVDCLKIVNDDERNNNIINLYFGLLLDLLDIKEKRDVKNISEVPTVSWWKDFTSNNEKIKVRNQYKLESDIVSKKKWADRSVMKTLTMIRKSVGERNFKNYLDLRLEEKENELTPIDFMQIEKYINTLNETGEIESWSIQKVVNEA